MAAVAVTFCVDVVVEAIMLEDRQLQICESALGLSDARTEGIGPVVVVEMTRFTNTVTADVVSVKVLCMSV